MDSGSFWLITFEEESVNVSYIKVGDQGCAIVSVGPKCDFNPSLEDSDLEAVNNSLSQASQAASLGENEEPTSAALIVPSLWVGSDGKIDPRYSKKIESICKKLKLRPLGFVSHEEAIIEDVSTQDGIPPSFIIIYTSGQKFSLSLIYLGKIKKQVQKPIVGRLSPAIVEQALVELNSDSTLPPQIIFLGQNDDKIIKEFQDYDWVGKKNFETFLHFPEIKAINQIELYSICCRVIYRQTGSAATTPSPSPSLPTPDQPPPLSDSFPKATSPPESDNSPQDTTAAQMGFLPFSISDNTASSPTPPVDIPQTSPPPLSTPPKPPFSVFKPPRLSFSLPKPKIKLPSGLKRAGIFFLIISPLLCLIPFFLTRAKITLFLTPYTLNKEFLVQLTPSVSAVDRSKLLLPVSVETFRVSVSSTIKTTGTKLVGEKAKGEVAIFNKLDSPQTIPKGSVLLDSSGRKFETQNQVSVASSSSNLEEGVITLGQTKTIVQAQDIGPEYNIAKDTKLTLKDHPETSLVAKSQQAFVGGTKEQISAVGQEDVKLVQEKIKQSIESAIDQKTKEDINNLAGAIKETLKIKQQKIEYSREIGEQADELTASVDAEISVLVLDQSLYPTIAEAFLASDESFQKSTKDSSSLSFAFSDINAGSDKTTAKLTISGLLTPLLDENKIKQDLKGKNLKYTHEYLQKNVPRVYNFTTQTNFPFLEFVNPFPFKVDRIEVETKIESP